MCRTPSLNGLEGSRVEISIAHHYLDAFIQGSYEILIYQRCLQRRYYIIGREEVM